MPLIHGPDPGGEVSASVAACPAATIDCFRQGVPGLILHLLDLVTGAADS
jgi:hypothetical protein